MCLPLVLYLGTRLYSHKVSSLSQRRLRNIPCRRNMWLSAKPLFMLMYIYIVLKIMLLYHSDYYKARGKGSFAISLFLLHFLFYWPPYAASVLFLVIAIVYTDCMRQYSVNHYIAAKSHEHPAPASTSPCRRNFCNPSAKILDETTVWYKSTHHTCNV